MTVVTIKTCQGFEQYLHLNGALLSLQDLLALMAQSRPPVVQRLMPILAELTR